MASRRRFGYAAVVVASAAVLVMMAVPVAAQVTTVVGKTADGSSYTFSVPASWNGDLVVYVHGIVNPGEPVAVPSSQDGFDALRAGLIDLGYAVAASSFSNNGYSVKSAVQRTHQLNGLFSAAFRRPARTFLAGHSLGALAVVALAEQYPGQYDGALAMCTPVAGGPAEIEYLGNARVLFDYFFPGVLPGGAFTVPADVDFSSGSPLFNKVLMALATGGAQTVQFATVAKLPYTNGYELIASAMSVVGFSMRFTNDVMARTHRHVPFDNIETTYVGSWDDDAVNDRVTGVARFSAAPDAANYFDHYYTPTGALAVPTMMLHTRWDPIAPFGQQGIYAGRVEGQGAAGWLTQRSIQRYGHCAISGAETLSGFQALVEWVNGGPKPANGDGTIR